MIVITEMPLRPANQSLVSDLRRGCTASAHPKKIPERGSETSERLDCSCDEGVIRRMVRVLGPLKALDQLRAPHAKALSTADSAAVRKGSATLTSISKHEAYPRPVTFAHSRLKSQTKVARSRGRSRKVVQNIEKDII
jgi:hypothetical protein